MYTTALLDRPTIHCIQCLDVITSVTMLKHTRVLYILHIGNEDDENCDP